jgi:carboxypeptidase family protein
MPSPASTAPRRSFRLGVIAAMKRAFGLVLSLVVLSALLAFDTSPAMANRAALATITGSVKDEKGNPLAGALISLLKEGAKQAIKQTRTNADGHFTTKIAPGRYGIRAIAAGFNEVVFGSVEVRASQELVYRFNLEPTGSGKTLPEQRKDRGDVRWVLRSAHTRKSIFQVQEGEDSDIQAALGSDETIANVSSNPERDDSEDTLRINSRARTVGVIESYFAGNADGPGYAGLSFAVATPASENIELVVAGQTGVGPGAPGRLEAFTRFRVGERHKVEIGAGGIRLNAPTWVNRMSDASPGQFSVRAVDEWIVRDGVVIVLGLDYSRFIGAGRGHSVTPRFGVQFDANARTRLKAAYAPGGDEGQIQSVAGFEDTQVVFTDSGNRPVAFIDGEAVMERSRRLEFGVERVLDNDSNVEATAFFDTTSGRGVGLLSGPISAFSGATSEALINVANQQGASRGMRVLYTRRLRGQWTASAGYSFGQGQRLSPLSLSSPADMFTSGFFQTAALQLGAGFSTGTHVRTVLRFSPNATVFAIDPFAGQIGVYDPSLSIQITQDLPRFGLPVKAEAVLDARNLLDSQVSTDNGEIFTQLTTGRRSVRGGISVRF